METDMTRGNPLPIILKFTLPLLIGNIFQQLYNMADTIIVGRFVGPDALAAVGSTGTIMFLVIGFSQGMSTGFTVLTSQRFGAGDTNGAKRSVANGIILSAFVIIIMTAVSLSFMRPLLMLMNTPENILEDAYTYISIICMGIVANVFYNLFSSYLRSVGNSRIPLLFLIFSACLNVILDLIFIINLGMGVAGAAWATNLSQGISALLCIAYICKKVPVLTPERNHWRLSEADSRHQLSVGIPMALQFGITASGTIIMQSAVNLFGSTAVAAYTATNKFQSMVIQGMMAMGQTMATYSGQNFGKGDIKRIRQGVRLALGTEVIYALLCTIIVCLGLPYALKLFFSGDVDIAVMLPWAKTFIYLCAIFYIPLGTIFIFRNTMQGCGYGFLPMMGGVVELAARLVTAALAIRLLSYPLACACDPAAWFSAAVFTGISYRYIMKKVEKNQADCGSVHQL
ncbi:MATE family efflux transporter [Clostridium sp. Marseille-P2415]|uniref:MATE family efflux transporter n=1 Tax=Clostridium sp. Marseille-P2415 TaxID=1805471 RepID=UPI0009886471|nr:MATE family efflux transporter [Clostridium sp. Marseille-P2415]